MTSRLNVALDEVGSSEGDVVGRSVVLDLHAGLLHLGTGETSEGVGTIRSSDESSLSEIILGLEVANLGLVRSIYYTHGDGEYCVALAHLLANDCV